MTIFGVLKKIFSATFRWLIASLFVGGLVTWGLLGILNLCFPNDAPEWGLSFLGLWPVLSLVVGLPPHTRLDDPKYTPIVNFSGFAIATLLTGFVMAGLLMLLAHIFNMPEMYLFVQSHFWTVYLASLLYTTVSRIGDQIWQRLYSL